jgi:hypothetical protein
MSLQQLKTNKSDLIKCYILFVLQAAMACEFVPVCPCTFFMAPILSHDAVHPYLALHIIRELPFAVCTNDILCLVTIFVNCIGLDAC